MKLLEIKNYEEGLSRICNLDFNTFFAQSVLKGHADGVVYVDDPYKIHVLYIIHKYGMSLLYSDILESLDQQEIINQIINKNPLVKNEWMQCFPEDWKYAIRCYNGPGIINENTRINFQLDKHLFRQSQDEINPEHVIIEETSKEMFLEMKGGVTPKYFWRNAEMFNKFGKGFSVLCDGALVTTAFASYVIDNYLEIGIETIADYQGRGYARAACTELIKYALRHDLIPVWSCRGDNIGSINLATKLGFCQTKTLPYFNILLDNR